MPENDPHEYFNNLSEERKKIYEDAHKKDIEHVKQMQEKPPNKLAGKFALATAALATTTVAALFNDATMVAAVSGILTGLSAPVTAYTFLAEQTNC